MTEEELIAAAKQHATASAMAKRAKTLQDEARDTLLTVADEDSNHGTDSGGKYFRFKGNRSWEAVLGGVVVTVTRPQAAPVMPTIKDEDAQRAAEEMLDMWGRTEGVFDFRFNPDRCSELLRDDKTDPLFKDFLKTLLNKYLSPGEPSRDLAPRVTSSQQKSRVKK